MMDSVYFPVVLRTADVISVPYTYWSEGFKLTGWLRNVHIDGPRVVAELPTLIPLTAEDG